MMKKYQKVISVIFLKPTQMNFQIIWVNFINPVQVNDQMILVNFLKLAQVIFLNPAPKSVNLIIHGAMKNLNLSTKLKKSVKINQTTKILNMIARIKNLTMKNLKKGVKLKNGMMKNLNVGLKP